MLLGLLAGSFPAALPAHQTPAAQKANPSAVYLPAGRLPVIDGDLSEWPLTSEPVIRGQHFWILESELAADLPFVIELQFAWSQTTNSLYLAARGLGPSNVHPEHPWSMRYQYLLGFFFDVSHSGQPLLPEEAEAEIRAARYDFSRPRTEELGSAQAWIINPWHASSPLLLVGMEGGWAAQAPYAETAFRFNARRDQYRMEARLKLWDHLDRRGAAFSKEHRLEAGQPLGFNILFFLILGGAPPEGSRRGYDLNALTAPRDPLWTSTAYPHLHLAPPQDRDTEVSPSSWGRIKAGFEASPEE